MIAGEGLFDWVVRIGVNLLTLGGLLFILHVSILVLAAFDYPKQLLLVYLALLLGVPPFVHLFQLLALFLALVGSIGIATAEKAPRPFDDVLRLLCDGGKLVLEDREGLFFLLGEAVSLFQLLLNVRRTLQFFV